MDHKKKFGLVMPKKSDTLKLKSKSVFDSDSDEDVTAGKRPKIPQKKIDFKSKIKEASLEDPSIYEYDSIYDDMKAKQAESIAPKEKKNSRYIETLLKAADKRKMGYERHIEKKIQVEREKEGDKYKDKEAFVTSAYKKKMLEREEEEERERREAMLNEMMDVTKQKDLSGFYRHFLKQTVGEEKIPTFDVKHIKKEVVSEEEKVKSDKSIAGVESKNDSKIPDIKNIDRDSDGIEIDSDSDNEASDSNIKGSNIKHLRNESKISSSENSSSNEKQNKINKHKKKISLKTKSDNLKYIKQNKIYRKLVSSSSELETEREIIENSNKGKDFAKLEKIPTKRNIHQQRHDSSDDSDPDKTLIPDQSSIGKHNVFVENVKKPNIYAKRTIGDVFAEAQARYYQRMANQNGVIP